MEHQCRPLRDTLLEIPDPRHAPRSTASPGCDSHAHVRRHVDQWSKVMEEFSNGQSSLSSLSTSIASPSRTSAAALSLDRWEVCGIYNLLDSCDLERSYRVIRGPCPAAWQIPAQRLGQSGHPGITGHGRTPTASAATHAPVVDRRPQWFG